MSRVSEVMWMPVNGPGLEHLRLEQRDDGAAASGMVIAVADGVPFRLRYTVICDTGWRVNDVRLSVERQGGLSEIILQSDGEGRWMTEPGEPLPQLDGCTGIDLSATPFTNTLPIRRLGLEPGESAEIDVVYFRLPEAAPQPMHQRYTCLDLGPNGGRFLYESATYRAELPVDRDGLVIDYPGVWRRIWP